MRTVYTVLIGINLLGVGLNGGLAMTQYASGDTSHAVLSGCVAVFQLAVALLLYNTRKTLA